MTSTATLIVMLYFIQESLGSGFVIRSALPQSPIVGLKSGHSVDIEDAPYMASLVEVDSHHVEHLFCEGSIIHKQFVLTAAQCLDYPPLFVRVGSSYLYMGGRLHHVEKYIKHEHYNVRDAPDYDVALLKLTEPVTFGPSVAVIKLADDSVSITAGLTANVTGWGETEHDEESKYLQQVSVAVSRRELCVYNNITVTDKQICAKNEKKGFCMRDSGAPLTAGDLQIGIAAYGPACQGLPNVYVKVAPHLGWIRNKIIQNV